MATTVTKIGPRYQVVIPQPVREAVGFKAGDWVEAQAGPNNTVILKPKLLVDRDPELEARLAEAEADLQAGRVLGPFTSVAEVRRALKDYKQKLAAEKRGRKRTNTQRAVTRRAHARHPH